MIREHGCSERTACRRIGVDRSASLHERADGGNAVLRSGCASSPISAVSSAAGGWRTASAGPGGEARSNSSLLARRRPRSQSSSPESLSRRNRD